MGFIRDSFGRVCVESRRESFILHVDHGGAPGPSPEFLTADLDDVIAALSDYRASLPAAGRAAATPDPQDALALLREEFGRNMAIMRRIENVLSPRDPRVPSGLPIGYGGPYFEGEGHNDLHGAWAEGYAAGKVASDDAAACDERDKAVEAVSVAAIHHVEAMREMRGKVDELRADRDRMKQAFRDFRADAEAIPAASPDERPQTDADCQDDCTAHRTCVERRGEAGLIEALDDAMNDAADLLAAADREKPKEHR